MPLPLGAIDRLESMAMDAYLIMLQDAVYCYIQLQRIQSVFLKDVTEAIIPRLKQQLNTVLFGTMSSSVRQGMMDKILSGTYPTFEYQNQYR